MSELVIEKVKTTKFKVKWAKPNFCVYDDNFVRIRSKMRDKLSVCFRCNTKFKIGDSIGIVGFESHKNKCLCSDCSVVILNALKSK